ncbi:MAG TPA: hypothetical protein VHH13_09360, partial [Arthrobacter sp.]|nr:hypothetical protein [Arthrobacter sp.]
QEIVIRRRARQLQAAMPAQVTAEAASSSFATGSTGSTHANGSAGATGSASMERLTSAGPGTGSHRATSAVATVAPSAESGASDAPANGQASRRYGPGWTKEAGFAFKTFGWMAGFLVLIGILGYLVAVMIFVPAFLLIVARATTKTTIIYTAVLYAVLLALPTLLPIDLPQGWLSQLVG